MEHLKPEILEYQVVRKAKLIIWRGHIESKLMIERYLEVLERHLVVADLKKEISMVMGIWLLWALVLTSLVFIVALELAINELWTSFDALKLLGV